MRLEVVYLPFFAKCKKMSAFPASLVTVFFSEIGAYVIIAQRENLRRQVHAATILKYQEALRFLLFLDTLHRLCADTEIFCYAPN